MTIAVCAVASAQEEPESVFERVNWQLGPAAASLGDKAEITLPEEYLFADGNDTRLLMEAMQNPTSGAELGFVAPRDLAWFVVFEFSDIGYVRDDEKHELDADEIMASLRAGNEAGNKERRKRGWPEFRLVGWEIAPRYNETTNNLEWATRGESEGHQVINYNTRLLGREGVMMVTLVTGPEEFLSVLPDYRNLIGGFTYKPGRRYAEYRPGDKAAKVGLSALVVGGATAAAVKTGAFKWLWKLLVLAFVAAGGLVKKLFSGKART
jgi:uncharacterized membrane-anchored protein